MTTLYLPIGPPGAGKSYLAQEAVNAGLISAVGVVSPDDYREILTGSVSDQSANDRVFTVVDTIINTRLGRGLDTWLDATNLGSTLGKWECQWGQSGVMVVPILFTASLDTLLFRNAHRQRVVPEDVVTRMWAQTKSIAAGREFMTVADFRIAYMQGV